MIRMIVTGCVIFVVSSAAVAQGAFDFDDIPGVNEAPVFAVDFNPFMIGFIREMARQADPETADMLGGLRSIRLRVYNSTDRARQFNSFINNVTEELEDSGWQRVMAAQDESSVMRMHMQMTAEEVSGLTVMFIDGDEAVFINIDGTVSAADLGRVLAALPVEDVLGKMAFPPVMPRPGAPRAEPTAD